MPPLSFYGLTYRFEQREQILIHSQLPIRRRPLTQLPDSPALASWTALAS